VVVPDNASLRASKVTKAARPGLAKAGVCLYYLPPYSPELDLIEAVFEQVEDHEIPIRSHATRAELREAAERGFAGDARKLGHKPCKQLRPAA
jgi:transposase